MGNPLQTLLEMPAVDRVERGLEHTPREIWQQPDTWATTYGICAAQKPDLSDFLRRAGIGRGTDGCDIAADQGGDVARAAVSAVPAARSATRDVLLAAKREAAATASSRRDVDVYFVDDFHTVRKGKNGGGDPWYTDGRLEVGVLRLK